MKLGKESRYAIEELLVLARKRFATTIQFRKIAATAVVPANFIAKMFQELNRANIVASARGVVRGYALAHKSNALTSKEMFLAVEGGDVFDRRLFWTDRCADLSPCPMHFQWQRVRQNIAKVMEQTTLADLARQKPQQ